MKSKKKKMCWTGYAGEGLRTDMKASHLSRYLKEGRVWTTEIWEKRSPDTEDRRCKGPEVGTCFIQLSIMSCQTYC